jgi:hypothetical protein
MVKVLSVLLTIPLLLLSLLVFTLVLIFNKLFEKGSVIDPEYIMDSDYLSYCVIPAPGM